MSYLGFTNSALLFSPLEQAAPRGYVRPLFCFSLGPSYDQDEVVRVLNEGLKATKETVPYLEAEVVTDDEAEVKGTLTLAPGDFGELHVKRLTKDEFPLTYDELRARGFPAHVFPEHLMCPVPIFPQGWEHVPVFAAQANFIEGGLILNFCVYHMTADNFSISKIMAIWAQNCLKAQDPQAPKSVYLSSSAYDRAPLVLGHLSDPNRCNIEDHPDFVVAPEPRVPKYIDISFHNQVFHFSRDALHRLKADAAPKDGGHARATIDDYLGALVWAATVRAQTRLADVDDEHNTSIMTIGVNPRMRTFPPLAPDYMGCPLVYATSRADLRAMLSEAGPDLSELTTKVRDAMATITPEYVSTTVNMYSKVHDYRCLEPRTYTGLGGPHVMMASWESLSFYEADWGKVLGGHCERVRTVHEGIMSGCQFVLPWVVNADGKREGLEVVMGMEKENLEKLRNDPFWLKYATPI